MQPVAFSRSVPQDSLPTIEIDDSRTFQPIEGFGFSLTGGSAHLLAGLAATNRADLLQELFGLTDASVGLSCLRLTIGASDLGGRAYSYWELDPGTADPDRALRSRRLLPGGGSRAAGDIADQSGCEDHRFAVVGTVVDEE
jgi:glucosylceramidase